MFLKKIKEQMLNSLQRFTHDKSSAIYNMNNSTSLNPFSVQDPKNLHDKKRIYKWIEDGIRCFREWYQPVDFGNGVVAHVTVPPHWSPRPDLLNDNTRRLSKWNYIIRKHIPDVKEKRILDLGCSSGLYSIELARMGAKEVIGIDRNEKIRHRSTDTPPPQDVIAQAKFVKKAFELLDDVEYPITYIAHDIGRLQDLKLGRFDLILALCVVYHELDKMPELVRQLANMTDHLILQASQAHDGELGRCADKVCHVEVLLEAGFTYVEIDAPIGYPLPVIVGRKGGCVPR